MATAKEDLKKACAALASSLSAVENVEAGISLSCLSRFHYQRPSLLHTVVTRWNCSQAHRAPGRGTCCRSWRRPPPGWTTLCGLFRPGAPPPFCLLLSFARPFFVPAPVPACVARTSPYGMHGAHAVQSIFLDIHAAIGGRGVGGGAGRCWGQI